MTVEWLVGKTNEDTVIRWMRLATFHPVDDRPPLHVGISDCNEWVIDQGTSGFARIGYGEDYSRAFPLMEIELPEVMNSISEGLQTAGLSGSQIKSFPVARIISSALRWPTRHWPNDALRWAAVATPDLDIEEGLSIIEATGTQSQRHTARQLLRRRK